MSDGWTCDARATAVFLVGLVAGTACTVLSKMIFQSSAVGLSGELEPFRPRLFQTWVMFLSMSFALPVHLVGEAWRRAAARGDAAELQKLAEEQAKQTTLQALLPLTVPAMFDLISTVLMILGIIYINASVWMLLRGGGVVFVALMKNFFLSDNLRPNMWVGVFMIASGVVLVGLSSKVGFTLLEGLDSKSNSNSTAGVVLTLLGTFVQSLQYTYEEKVLSLDIFAPPWLLISAEGIFCTILCSTVLYPVFQFLPGDDHGSYESFANTATQLGNSPQLLALCLCFGVSVFVLNAFSVLVTYMMPTVWHAVLDNIRPVAIWVAQLILYYQVTDGKYGEAWSVGSWVQLMGLGVMLLGTAVYNGSIRLPGLPTGASLVHTASPMSTRATAPALARSPLIARNPGYDLGTGQSPYARRPDLGPAEPLDYAAGATRLDVGLISGHRS